MNNENTVIGYLPLYWSLMDLTNSPGLSKIRNLRHIYSFLSSFNSRLFFISSHKRPRTSVKPSLSSTSKFSLGLFGCYSKKNIWENAKDISYIMYNKSFSYTWLHFHLVGNLNKINYGNFSIFVLNFFTTKIFFITFKKLADKRTISFIYNQRK